MKTKEEIAYYLGTQIAAGFYGFATWTPNEDPVFPHFEYYEWTCPTRSSSNGEDWKIRFLGEIKEDIFKSEEEKLSYLKGAITCAKINGTTIEFNFANNIQGINRLKKLFKETEYTYKPYEGGEFKLRQIDDQGLISLTVEEKNYIPNCNKLVVEISEKFLNRINNA